LNASHVKVDFVNGEFVFENAAHAQVTVPPIQAIEAPDFGDTSEY
jgi:hypothetical protein